MPSWRAINERRGSRPPRRPRPLGARWRLAQVARVAVPDRLDGVQAHLLRHRARLPVVAVPAAAALRGPAARLHPRRSAGILSTPLRGAAAAEHRAVRVLS